MTKDVVLVVRVTVDYDMDPDVARDFVEDALNYKLDATPGVRDVVVLATEEDD
jgi:multidrug efflux pump subunit AcrB